MKATVQEKVGQESAFPRLVWAGHGHSVWLVTRQRGTLYSGIKVAHGTKVSGKESIGDVCELSCHGAIDFDGTVTLEN